MRTDPSWHCLRKRLCFCCRCPFIFCLSSRVYLCVSGLFLTLVFSSWLSNLHTQESQRWSWNEACLKIRSGRWDSFSYLCYGTFPPWYFRMGYALLWDFRISCSPFLPPLRSIWKIMLQREPREDFCYPGCSSASYRGGADVLGRRALFEATECILVDGSQWSSAHKSSDFLLFQGTFYDMVINLGSWILMETLTKSRLFQYRDSYIF